MQEKTDNSTAGIPFAYGLVLSLFSAAREGVDQVFQELGAYQELSVVTEGTPPPPDRFAKAFSQLPQHDHFRHIGSCLRATTNLGLAYAHTFRILSLVTNGQDPFQKYHKSRTNRLNLVTMYDSLSKKNRNQLNKTYNRVKTNDFEMEFSFGPFPTQEESGTKNGKKLDLREQLVYWQAEGLLQDSHMMFTKSTRSVHRILLPYRSLQILDNILAYNIAPLLGLKYNLMDNDLSNRQEDPKLSWDGSTVSVSLPDKLGRVLQGQWNPNITSVIRIKKKQESEWSPGFETPFNTCTFVGLEPDTEYEVMLTHKNEVGEGEPTVTSMRTEAEK